MNLTAVLDAKRRIAPYLKPTALHRYPALDELIGTEIWVKHESGGNITTAQLRELLGP